MRRTKQDMILTREQILQSAFACFFDRGYEATSLDLIAQQANMTRGAIYWHFEDKRELYRAVVDLTLERANIVKFARTLPASLSMRERFETVFWWALNENRYVDFVFRTMNYTSGKAEFADVYQKLRDVKRELLRYFEEEVSLCLQGAPGKNAPQHYALSLFFMFEGMFLTKNITLGVDIGREEVSRFVGVALGDLAV